MLSRADVILLATGGAAISSAAGGVMPDWLALSAYSGAGATLAAIFCAVWGNSDLDWQTLGRRIVSAAALGFAITPTVMRWRGWALTPDTVMGASAGVGVAVWVSALVFNSLTITELHDGAMEIWRRLIGKGGGK